MTALTNKTVAHAFLQSFKRTLTVSVNKDCRDPENLPPPPPPKFCIITAE